MFVYQNKLGKIEKELLGEDFEMFFANDDEITDEMTDDEIEEVKERNEEHKRQREELGFDEKQLWSLDITMAYFIYPRLKEFSENLHGYPAELGEEMWRTYLDNMVFAFELILREQKKDISNEELDYLWSDEVQGKIQDGLELFGKYFKHLWT